MSIVMTTESPQNTPAPEADGTSNNTIIESMLDLEEIDKDLFRSKKLWVPMGARGVFGGNVVGQALVAATNTVSTDYSVHSLHSYFLMPGDPSTPILYEVDRVRDGKSYCTRTVTAKQRGNNIFVCTASFQVPRPNAASHQYPMPDVPHHNTLRSQEELILAMIASPKVPDSLTDLLKQRLAEPVALDFKDTRAPTLKDLRNPEVRTEQMFWIKCKGDLASPQITMMASLDHSMWFHCPFRADEWMLYVCETPRSGCDRGLAFGRIYKEDGTLAVTVAQEGVVRMRPAKTKSDKPKL
ncbi:Acyl-CoA thioesterase 8 [Podila horticola]|nr:Acyl-CoA thioesterase 8 [Podila horticola]